MNYTELLKAVKSKVETGVISRKEIERLIEKMKGNE